MLRSLKGQGAPERVAGKPLEGAFHSHQVPLKGIHGRPVADVLAAVADGTRRIGMQPAGDGGRLREPLDLPDLGPYAVDVSAGPGSRPESPNQVLADWLTEIMRRRDRRRVFRIVSPDELASNKLDAVLTADKRAFAWPVEEYAEDLAPDGRVMEILSEHNGQGWLQGY
ncbi:hypothetical protein OOK47_09350 [Streptomyces sp. NBC_00268]|nr:hypothetical protein [Streptomyces mirabilis]MCX5182841.1 hypothetical protein [Streptomyces sp. NBC_00268]